MQFSSNEDKIKEMWDKFCYSLCRSETHDLLSLSVYVFSTLQAFQYFQKNFFDSVLLRRMSFEELIGEITKRIKQILNSIWSIVQKTDNSKLSGLGFEIDNKLKQELQNGNPWLLLQKLQNHLLALFNPEFLFINARRHCVGVGDFENQVLQQMFETIFST